MKAMHVRCFATGFRFPDIWVVSGEISPTVCR